VFVVDALHEQQGAAVVSRSIVDTVRNYMAIVREHFPVKRVIPYGSYARGAERPDSDIDVAIVLSRPPTDHLEGRYPDTYGDLPTAASISDIRQQCERMYTWLLQLL
jgi:hypothetical protein